MQRVFPPPLQDFAPETIYDHLGQELPAPPADRPLVVLNMVASVDGKVAMHGSAAGIGSPTDQQLMRAVRQPFDAVLCGAGTLRADRADSTVGPEREQRRVAQGLPPRPLAVVLSTTGDLPYDRSDFAQRQPYRISLVGSGTPADRREKLTAWGQLFVAPTKRPTAQWVLQTLQEQCGVRRLLVEGGPAINGLFLEAGMIDEICWTLAPKLIGSGEDLTMITHGVLPHPQRLTLRTAYLHEDEFFFRHAVMHDQA